MKLAAANRLTSLPFIAFVVVVQVTLVGCAANVSMNGTDPPPSGSGSISGAFIDDSTQRPVPGAIVLLEQVDSAGIDRVVRSTTTASDGTFVFTSLASGNYDLVATASITSGGSTITYATTVTLRVPTDSTLNGIPLVPEFGDSMPTGLPVDIGSGGTITASGNSPAQVDVQLSALQGTMTQGGALVRVTIPTFVGSSPGITTMTGSTCPPGTACANYSLLVPSSSPVVGTYDPMQTSYTNPTTGPVEVVYIIEGKAFVHGGTTPDCTPSTQTTKPVVPRGTLPSAMPNLSFTDCL
jgi:hypothetical protein